MQCPVVKQKKALYGHPLAGLYWEQHLKDALNKIGYEPIKGWECLYVHRPSQLFLSIYVDDFKLCGKRSSIAPMWDEMRKYLTIDDPTPLHQGVYLGNSQFNIDIPWPLVDSKKVLWDYSYKPGSRTSETSELDAIDFAKIHQQQETGTTLSGRAPYQHQHQSMGIQDGWSCTRLC